MKKWMLSMGMTMMLILGACAPEGTGDTDPPVDEDEDTANPEQDDGDREEAAEDLDEDFQDEEEDD
ncbi:hypothetical protein [Salinicoccus bachuensis]|uniref:DNA primase n=1 Tax=Salinicoccus bachuensis TaxID=3136731 RepID=A0ABZ3CGP4_9STAP